MRTGPPRRSSQAIEYSVSKFGRTTPRKDAGGDRGVNPQDAPGPEHHIRGEEEEEEIAVAHMLGQDPRVLKIIKVLRPRHGAPPRR